VNKTDSMRTSCMRKTTYQPEGEVQAEARVTRLGGDNRQQVGVWEFVVECEW
jgi:hypothetical protein